MRALLDTHTFIWWNMGIPDLSQTARDFIGDENNEIYLSAVSAWEIAIKYRKGKLTLPEPPKTYVESRAEFEGFIQMPILFKHTIAIGELPNIHNDPFDHLLMAQSLVEGMPLISADSHIQQYPIDIIR